MLGKPVIHFSSHGRLVGLPHVHNVRSFRDLDIIDEILRDDSPESEARRRRDGARFHLALFEYGFDLGELDLQGRDRPTAEELTIFCDTLEASLAATPEPSQDRAAQLAAGVVQ